MPRKRPDSADDLEAMWSSFDSAVLSVALDGADPERALAEMDAVLRRHLGRRFEDDGLGEALDPASMARIGRAFALVRAATSRLPDAAGRSAQDDVGDAIAAVVANLEVAAGSLGDDTRAGRMQIVTAIGYARTAAARAAAGVRGLPR